MSDKVFKDLCGEKGGEELENKGTEEKRESLVILATLGETKSYLGKEMSVEQVMKFDDKKVERYFKRYQAVSGKQVSSLLSNRGIRILTRALSFVVPIDDVDSLNNDLEKDELVQREITNLAGAAVIKGGRFVALASALMQVVSHIKFSEVVPANSLIVRGKTVEVQGDSEELASESKTLLKED